MGLNYVFDGGKKKFLQKFDEESSWKLATWTKYDMGGNGYNGCEIGGIDTGSFSRADFCINVLKLWVLLSDSFTVICNKLLFSSAFLGSDNGSQ